MLVRVAFVRAEGLETTKTPTSADENRPIACGCSAASDRHRRSRERSVASLLQRLEAAIRDADLALALVLVDELRRLEADDGSAAYATLKVVS